MTDFQYGPVELYLIGFSGERPGTDLVEALLGLVQSNTVRLLDVLFIARSAEGESTVLELEEVADSYGLAGLEAFELGLAGEEDVDDLSEAIPPGTSAAVLVVEHVWVREFAESLYRAGGRVLSSERIPAPVVNEMVFATTT